MTNVLYVSSKVKDNVIKNVNNAVTNVRKDKNIVNSFDIPSLNSGSYLKNIPNLVEDIAGDCINIINGIEDSSNNFNNAIDNICSDVSKIESTEITAKDFYVN